MIEGLDVGLGDQGLLFFLDQAVSILLLHVDERHIFYLLTQVPAYLFDGLPHIEG